MRTANPALNDKTFDTFSRDAIVGSEMTIEGTVTKTGVLLALLFVGAAFSWYRFFSLQTQEAVMLPLIGGLIGGLIFSLIIVFRPTTSPWATPLYAVCEGLFLGAVSGLFEIQLPGIVIQAVALTFGTLLVLLFVYRAGIIRATENFKMGIVAATGAICLIYLVTMVLRLFGTTIPYIHSNGTVGIIFSLVVVTIAALNLVLDFDFIEKGAAKGAPKYMEWYGAFGLLVTLVWLYLEILRLLAKFRSRD